MMLTTTYHYACSTLNVGAGAFVVNVVPKLSPHCIIHCISANSIYLNRYNDKARSYLSVRYERALSHLYAIH